MTGAVPRKITHLLYLHGFRSSSLSAKARLTAAWMQEHQPDVTWWCPQLPPSPFDAMTMLQDGLARWPAGRTGVIGSSLGGFYATALAERIGCRAVLLNPAVDPARDLDRHHRRDNRLAHRGALFLSARLHGRVALDRPAHADPARTLFRGHRQG